MKVSKKAYLHVFTIIVLALGLLRLTTDIDEPKSSEEIAMADSLAVVNEEAEEESVPVSKETLDNPNNQTPSESSLCSPQSDTFPPRHREHG